MSEQQSVSQYSFRKPTRAIFTLEDLEKYQSSDAQKNIMEFLRNLGKKLQGRVLSSCGEVSSRVKGISSIISQFDSLIDKFPPLEKQAGSRFGNKAFRQWFEAMTQATPELISQNIIPENLKETNVVDEISTYLSESFGNSTRIDFGTGHEACFINWLYCLHASGILKEEDLEGVAFLIIPLYLKLVDRLVAVYSLEPAGTHGVWSLDDYHFLPFLLGALQLLGNRDLSPRSILDPQAIAENSSNYLYFGAVKTLRETKSSVAFALGAPMLNDIAQLPSWEIISSGLYDMFRAEVLGKFPVTQHFLFGSIIQSTWRKAPESPEAIPPPVSGLALLSMQKRSPQDEVDPFTKYFKHMRKQPNINDNRQQQHQIGIHEMEQQLIPHTKLDNNLGIKVNGWTIDCLKAPLSNAQELKAIEENGISFSLPEMFFGNNFLRIVNENLKVGILFDPVAAIAKCDLKCEVKGRTDVSVPLSESWKERSENVAIKLAHKKHDWTYTTDYMGTITQDGKAITPIPTSEYKINMDLLRRRDPILWFNEITLFESELDDFGLCKYSIKIRVMPSCFFLLVRFWVRIDGAIARVWDTRIFHEFSTKQIVFQHTKKEVDYPTLLSAVKSQLPSFFNDPENFIDHLRTVSEETTYVQLP